MKAGRELQAVTALLVAGLLLWGTTAQAFSFCFSTGGKARGNAWSPSRYYMPYGAWLPPPVPVMSYYGHAPYEPPYVEPVAPVSELDIAPEENQGLEYIMP
jgi:hypothetical protein